MKKRRSVMDRLIWAWENQPGSVSEVARRDVPEANPREIDEVERGSGSWMYGSVGSLRNQAMTRGKGVVPNGQQRIIRKPETMSG